MSVEARPVLDLKERFGSRFKVTFEETVKGGGISRDELWWYQEIRGRRGFIYPHSPTQLTVCIERSSPRGLGASIALVVNRTGWKAKRRGDCEAEFFFPESDIDFVCELIRARRRRQASPEEQARLSRIGFKSSAPTVNDRMGPELRANEVKP